MEGLGEEELKAEVQAVVAGDEEVVCCLVGGKRVATGGGTRTQRQGEKREKQEGEKEGAESGSAEQQKQEEVGGPRSRSAADLKEGIGRREFLVLIKHRKQANEYAIAAGTLGNKVDPMPKIDLMFPVLESLAVSAVLDEHRNDAKDMALATGIILDGDDVENGAMKRQRRYEFLCDPRGTASDKIHAFILLVNQAAEIAAQQRFRSLSSSHAWVKEHLAWTSGPTGSMSSGDGVRPELVRLDSRTERHVQSFAQHQEVTDATSLQMWKEDWVKSELIRRRDEFTAYEPLNVFIGTFNVNGQRPQSDLSAWLLDGIDGDESDLYILGLQEVDLSKEAFVFDSKREEEWVSSVQDALAPYGYVRLRSRQLVGMLLMAFVRRPLRAHVGDVHASVLGTGIMNMLGNKGGVAFSLSYRDSRLCFINTHLAAHDDNVARRNQNHHDLCKGVTFRTSDRVLTLFDHNYLFWLGDLNYRLDMFDADIKARVGEGQIGKLLEHDQLRSQQHIGAAFANFVEPSITFKPTYKYDVGTDTFDTSEKMRSPAYCDRILFHSQPDATPKSSEVSVLEYDSVPAIKLSDHKPVRGRFRLNIRVENAERRRETEAAIRRGLDAIENSALPVIDVSPSELNFPGVVFGRMYTQQVTVTNIGKVVAHYRYTPQEKGPAMHPPWLRVDSGVTFLTPGQQATINVSVCVDSTTAAALNSGKMQLDHTVVLLLPHGASKFISVRGDFVPTCLGRPLEDLCYLSQPASTVSRVKREGGPMYIPKELWLLVDFVLKHGLTQPGLLKTHDEEDVMEVIKYLDLCEEIPESTPASCVMQALLLFLKSLPNPVIPFAMYTRCLDHANVPTLTKQLVSELPTTHRLVFEYLMRFLDAILLHRDTNGAVPDHLLPVFARVLLQRPGDVPTEWHETNSNSERQVAFLRHFLAEYKPSTLPFV